MTRRSLLSLSITVLAASSLPAQDLLDRVDDALTWSSPSGQWRGRLSGTLDLEGYWFDPPAPGLMEVEGSTLFNPRLSLFVDGQMGEHLYFFVQSRLDRGFDPSDGDFQARMDEYALRLSPFTDHRFSVQVGKFATVMGNWAGRHLSWDNAFITAPLLYENTGHVSDLEAPSSRADFIQEEEEEEGYEHSPVIWGPGYSSGALVSVGVGSWDAAVALKNSAAASRPESWSVTDVGFAHPTLEGHVAYHPNMAWTLGLSASEGPYFREEALPTLPPGQGIGDYREFVVGQDIGYAWHHLQLWAEFYEARFEVPQVGGADTFGWYFEARYALSPQWFAAARWNQQWFGDIPDGSGSNGTWGDDVWRIDLGVGYRLTSHAQLKLQYNLKGHDSEDEGPANLGAVQFTVRF